MLRFEDYKSRTEQAFALLNSTSPYDIFARIEIMCSLKILHYQLSEFQCHVRDTPAHQVVRREIEEMYPSHLIYPSPEMIRHTQCNCANYALTADPAIVEKIESQANRLKQLRVIEPIEVAEVMIDVHPKADSEEVDVIETTQHNYGDTNNDAISDDRSDAVEEHDIKETLTTMEEKYSTLKTIIAHNVEEEHSVLDVEEEHSIPRMEELDMVKDNANHSDTEFEGYCSVRAQQQARVEQFIPYTHENVALAKSELDRLSIEQESNRRILAKVPEVAHYFKYERGEGKRRIRYDMYRLGNIIIRYDNKGSEKHMIQRRRENSDNILFEISDPYRCLMPEDFEPWLGKCYPSEEEEFNYAAIITKIRLDICSKRNRDLFNHRIKFLKLKPFKTSR